MNTTQARIQTHRQIDISIMLALYTKSNIVGRFEHAGTKEHC